LDWQQFFTGSLSAARHKAPVFVWFARKVPGLARMAGVCWLDTLSTKNKARGLVVMLMGG
jgi:hypothetical protein